MTTTIQRTSKPLKAASAICSVCFFGSFLMIGEDPHVAAVMLVGSVIAYPIIRVLIWWNHD